ncbi:hypothetical protein B7494_g3935 [Chlorociboria aeruginascens]|nr:hypothetical protein B7494_g3935 [Chlorociboria aeruginascens]
MDPASAIGVASSVVTFAIIVANGAKSLDHLRQKFQEAPRDLSRLKFTLNAHQALVVEMKVKLPKFEQINAPGTLREWWRNQLGELELDVKCFATMVENMEQKAKSGAIRMRVSMALSEARINEYMQTLSRHCEIFTLMQSELIDFRSQILGIDLLSNSRRLDSLSSEISAMKPAICEHFTGAGQKMIQATSQVTEALGSVESRITHLMASHTLESRDIQQSINKSIRELEDRLEIYIESATRHSFIPSSPFNSTRGPYRKAAIMKYHTRFKSGALIGYYRYPLGLLKFYQRKSPNCQNDFGIMKSHKSAESELHVSNYHHISIRFIPNSRLSNCICDLLLSIRTNHGSFWKFSFKVSCSRVCDDFEVFKCLGFNFIGGKVRSWAMYRPERPDPSELRKLLEEGRFSTNDIFLGKRVLQVFLSSSRNQWQSEEYEVCKLLLDYGAQMSFRNISHARSQDTLEQALANRIDCDRIGVAKNWYVGEYSIPSLLFERGASLSDGGQYGRLIWFLSLPNPLLHIKKDFIDHIDPTSISELSMADRWMISTLCVTLPGFQTSLLKHFRVFTTRPSISEFNVESLCCELRDTSPNNRCFFFGMISARGNSIMLRFFLEQGFDILEKIPYVKSNGVHECRDEQAYIINAARCKNADTFEFLLQHTTPHSLNALEFSRLLSTEFILDHVEQADLIKKVLQLGPLCNEPTSSKVLLYCFGLDRLSVSSVHHENAILMIDLLIQHRYCSYAAPPSSPELFLSAEIAALVTESDSYMKNGYHILLSHLLSYGPASLNFPLNPPSSLIQMHVYDLCFTPLAYAIDRGDLELVTLLLEAGADPTKALRGGKSALDLAKEYLIVFHPRACRPRPSWRLSSSMVNIPPIQYETDFAILQVLESELTNGVNNTQFAVYTDMDTIFHVLPGFPCDVIFGEESRRQRTPLTAFLMLWIYGRMTSLFNRKWRPEVDDTEQKIHDDGIEAEIYRKRKSKRDISKILDSEEIRTASLVEEQIGRAFDQGHENCIHCFGQVAGAADEVLTPTIKSESTLALCDIDISITAGKKIAICGRTGSGKSSLIALLLKLLDPLPETTANITIGNAAQPNRPFHTAPTDNRSSAVGSIPTQRLDFPR